MEIALRDRSRSPHNGSSSVACSAWPPMGCSFQNKTLVLNGVQIPFIHFIKGRDEIWMPAKPVMKTTGEANITHIMDRVFTDDKMVFEKLIELKGLPLEGCYGFVTPPNPEDYNEKKAIWVNESGFYAMVLGSRKPHCVAFQRWVLHEVLPSIRRHGSYGGDPASSLRLWFEDDLTVALKNRDDKSELAVRQRDDALQLAQRQRDEALASSISSVIEAVTSGFDERLARLEEVLGRRDERRQLAVRTLFADQQETLLRRHQEELQWRHAWFESIEHWRADNQQLSASIATLIARIASLPFMLGQKISDVIGAAVTRPGSDLIRNLRAATRRPSVRSTHSARRFPSEQKATQEEVMCSLLSQVSVAKSSFREMTYDVWKQVRGSFGKAVKKTRIQRHGLPADSAEYIDRPLLWSFAGEGTAEGGGQRYVVLQQHRALVQAVWLNPRSTGQGSRRRLESFDDEARRLQAEKSSLPGYVSEPWPLLSAEVEPDFASSGEE